MYLWVGEERGEEGGEEGGKEGGEEGGEAGGRGGGRGGPGVGGEGARARGIECILYGYS